jgi:hypothetical protein
MQLREESERLGAQDLREFLADRSGDRDSLGERAGHVHRSILLSEMWQCNMKSWTEGSSLNFQATLRDFTS